jgi:hypothetical protein
MATPSSDDVPDSADRISTRHAFETRIWIRLQRDGQKLSLQGWSRDLSERGVGAFVAEALILRESVTLEIPLPHCGKQMGKSSRDVSHALEFFPGQPGLRLETRRGPGGGRPA